MSESNRGGDRITQMYAHAYTPRDPGEVASRIDDALDPYGVKRRQDGQLQTARDAHGPAAVAATVEVPDNV